MYAQNLDEMIDLKKLLNSDTMAGRFEIEHQIDSGIYGLKYQVKDELSSKRYAMKVELPHQRRHRLQKEAFILKRLADCPHTSAYIGHGSYLTIDYLVLSMVGPDLAKLRENSMNNKFPLGLVLRIGIQCTEALREVHNGGFVLRDVRPENFALGYDGTKEVLKIVDFGAALQFRICNHIMTPEKNAGFYGSRLHASFNAHKGRELGAHDDMISLFYMMSELYNGNLPWSDEQDFQRIGDMKRTMKASCIFKNMPSITREIYRMVKHLKYGQPFSHNKIIDQLKEAADLIHAPEELQFDEPDILRLASASAPASPLKGASMARRNRNKSV
uniref:Protein kinase domain-containing protein n=1 Tax=Trichuris muris TaxID=70415 RepID=A0A5S6QEJ7_TRIMR